MTSDNLKIALKSYGVKESDIAKAIRYYDYAMTNGIPWPMYYALCKLMI